jgi:GST-like protein
MFGQGVHFVMHVHDGEHEYSRRRYLTQVRRLYDVMEAQLSGTPYLAGDEYSIADIATFPWAGRMYSVYGVSLDLYPAVMRWKEAIKERPAFERIRMLVNDLSNSEVAAIKSAHPDAVDRFMGRGRYSRA